jgi:hypothetical protein
MAQEKNLTQSQKDGNSSQVAYYSATEACDTIGTVVPASMAYNQQQFAKKLKVAIQPSIHEFVMNRLKYNSYEEFCKAFGREQIDAIANAIYNFENTGFGIIIADQTGVGKGRIGAGLIRYSIEHLGRMPVFVTEKTHLINDMFRDLIDIGYQANVPIQVKVKSMEVDDISDAELIKMIRTDLEENQSLRIDISEIIDDPEFNPEKLFVRNQSKNPIDQKDLDIIESAGLDVEAVKEFIMDEYRTYIQINGTEVYESDWVITEDNNYGLAHAEIGDNYQSLLQKEIKKGKKLIKPFILNDAILIKDENGNILYDAKVDKKAIDSKKLSSDYKVLMTPYSQFSRPFNKETGEPMPKFDFVRRLLVNDGLLILDESHRAAGVAPNGKLTNTGMALTDMIALAKDVIYISATYAKEPRNMFLYSEKTAIREAQLNNEELIDAFTTGGKSLQEATASELTAVGHLVRRERPIVGKTEYLYTDEDSEIGKEQISAFERFRDAMNYIKDEFQSQIYEAYKEQINILSRGDAEEKDRLRKTYPYQGNIGVLSFNSVQSFLLGLKVNQTVDIALNHLKSGKKPVIAVANTMESIFDNIKKSYSPNIPYELNDYIEDDLGLIFGYLIWYCCKIGERRIVMKKDEDGRMVEEEVIDKKHLIDDCPNNFLDVNYTISGIYRDLQKRYKNYKVYLPLSPIDKIVSEIQANGYTIAEITKRGRKLNYDKNNPSIAKLEKKKIVNVTDAIKDFNQNKTDVLVLNRSGAVGVSMHAKPNSAVPNFDKNILKIQNIDERPYPKSLDPRDEVKARVMIITQMETDINSEVQKLGRISRTGQIYAPEYNYIFSCLPLEKRFASMMERKMRSLMANVSAEQTQGASQFSFEDLLSKTGDECVISPAYAIGISIPKTIIQSKSVGAVVNYVLKQLYWKSVAQQKSFYNTFLSDFGQKLQQKIDDGTYDEKVLIKDYSAKTIDVLPISLGMDNPFSSFGFPVFAELMDIEVFEQKNFSQKVADTIGKKLLTLPDEYGKQVPLQDLATYQKYITAINDEYFEKSINDNYQNKFADLNNNIANAEAEIERLMSEMIGYQDFDMAESNRSQVFDLEQQNKEYSNQLPELSLAGNQSKVDEVMGLMQQIRNQIQILNDDFEQKYKEIYERKDEFKTKSRTIKSLRESIEKNKQSIIVQEGKLQSWRDVHDVFNMYVSKIGNIFNIKTYQEIEVDAKDDNGDIIVGLKKYEYTLIKDEDLVLTSIEYPFTQRVGMDYAYGSVKLYFTPAFGGFESHSLISFFEPFDESEILEGRMHITKIEDTNKKYQDSWDDFVQKSYSGERQNRVFLTGSTVKAITHAKQNKLSGSFVKFSTAQNTERIGYELTKVATQAIESLFNNVQDFPLSINITQNIVEGSIYYKFNKIIESIKADYYSSPYRSNFYRAHFLTFELTDKTSVALKDGNEIINGVSFLELKSNGADRVKEIKTLDEFIDSRDLYFRIASSNEEYIVQLVEIARSLGFYMTDSSYLDNQYRAFSFLAKKGQKPYSLKKKDNARLFSNNVPYYVSESIMMEVYERYSMDFTPQDNIFVNNANLRNEIIDNPSKIASWYNVKYAIDFSVADFIKVIDYLTKQGMALKSVLSYGLLKDSGNFVFDMDSYQRAFTVIEANGEGVIESDLSEEQEVSIDQRIEDLIDLFRK